MENLEALKRAALDAVAHAGDLRSLDDIRVNQLGKKGELTALLKGLGKLIHTYIIQGA
jgi:phenylalanyl-tRNA synthetase alpha chain